jgi:PAS domain S-box-containing protein
VGCPARRPEPGPSFSRLQRAIQPTIPLYDLERRRNVYANQETAEFLGYDAAQVRAQGPGFLEHLLHPEDVERVAAHHARCAGIHDEVLQIEYRLRHADGDWRWLRSRDLAFATTPDGGVTQILGSAEDITE